MSSCTISGSEPAKAAGGKEFGCVRIDARWEYGAPWVWAIFPGPTTSSSATPSSASSSKSSIRADSAGPGRRRALARSDRRRAAGFPSGPVHAGESVVVDLPGRRSSGICPRRRDGSALRGRELRRRVRPGRPRACPDGARPRFLAEMARVARESVFVCAPFRGPENERRRRASLRTAPPDLRRRPGPAPGAPAVRPAGPGRDRPAPGRGSPAAGGAFRTGRS